MINLIEESVKAAIADSMGEKKEDSSDLKAIWTGYFQKNSYGQCDTFLNVNWETLQDKKDEIVAIYVQYLDREQRLNGQNLGFGPFNLVLENLSKDNVQSVVEASSKYGDRPSMSKRFGELGLKLNNSKVTLLEALLFIYGQEKAIFVASPPTPAEANLRNAQNEQRNVLNGHKAREEEIAKLKKDLEEGNIKKMKIANEQLRLRRLEEDFKRDGVLMKRETKKAKQNVTVAQKLLEEENAAGTDASNWLKEEVEKQVKQSASAKWKK
eukprot:UN02555